MNLFAEIKRLFSVADQSDALNRAQFEVLSKQIPLLYTVLILNTLAVCFTHFNVAPMFLTVGLPAFFLPFAAIRSVVLFRQSSKYFPKADVRRKLTRTIIAAVVSGSIFCSWAGVLYSYGDAYRQTHVIAYALIMVFGFIGCLLPLRSISILTVLAFFLPASLFLFGTGNMVYIAIAVTLIVSGTATVIVAVSYARNFAAMIDFQGALVAKEVEAVELSERNFALANQDNLTGLANRRSFFSTLNEQLEQAIEDETVLAVGVLDLDGFKSVNDIYGHSAGDQLLIDVGRRLLSVVDESVFVARLGGDEFGLIVPSDLAGSQLEGIGAKIVAALKTPFELGEFTARISGSVGFSCFPESEGSAEELYEHADYALYHAKDKCAGETVFFTRELQAQIQELNEIRKCLREADFEKEMEPHFQFLFNTQNGQAIGAEALARWESPQLGFTLPSAFIEVAEQSGLINKLTAVLFRKTLLAAMDWPAHLNVTFNLSSRDIGSPQCILQLISIINELDFDARRLVFEITESAVMGNYEKAREFLDVLKVTGARIALDDFGTGYSSLSYVRSLPLDVLKIDRSFVTDIENDKTAQSVMRTFVDLSRNLNLQCIVEGVETEAQLEVLTDIGCYNVQGYLFSKPMKQDDVHAFLSAHMKIASAQ